MLEEFVAMIGLADRFAGVRTIAPTGGQIAANRDAALPDLAAACEACARDDGAQVVILGGAALAGLAARIQPKVSVPVICSVDAGTRAAMAAARAGLRATQRPQSESLGLSESLAAMLGARLPSP